MAKQPSSIKGDRSGMLLGDSEPSEAMPQPVEAPDENGPPGEELQDAAVVAEEAVDQPEVEEEFPGFTDAEIDQALFEEASGGEPELDYEEAPWAMDAEWPPSPEAELALFEDRVAFGAEDEAGESGFESYEEEPDTAAPDWAALEAAAADDGVQELTTLERSTPEQAPADEVEQESIPAWAEGLAEVADMNREGRSSDDGAPILASEENMYELDYADDLVNLGSADDQVATPVSPRPTGGSLAAVDIQTPEEPVERLELPEREIPAERSEALAAAAVGRLKQWEEEIDAVYQEVIDQVGANDDITTDCFNQLLRARDILLRQDVGRLAQAEYYIEQARARLRRAEASSRGAKRNAWWILGWGFLWAMVFVAGLVMLDSAIVQDYIDSLGLTNTFFNPDILLPAMVWGGLGGVVAIWYSLFKHVSQRDFDTSYNISYVGKPFFGLILGATVYMVINLLIVSLGIWPANLPEELGSLTIAPWIVYLLAWVGGFKENRVFGVVDYAVKRVFSPREAAAPPPPTGIAS